MRSTASRHLMPIERSAGSRSSSLAKRDECPGPGCCCRQYSSRHANTFSRCDSTANDDFSPIASENGDRQITRRPRLIRRSLMSLFVSHAIFTPSRQRPSQFSHIQSLFILYQQTRTTPPHSKLYYPIFGNSSTVLYYCFKPSGSSLLFLRVLLFLKIRTSCSVSRRTNQSKVNPQYDEKLHAAKC
jgi:hypothetical protein